MIVVECYSDEFLVKSMGFPRKKIKHGGGIGNVVRAVSKKEKGIGIIDEDPHSNQPKEMEKYDEADKNDTIKLLVKKDDNRKRIIQISPYFEPWLINRARQNQISPKDFGLPDDPKEMHDVLHIERNRNYQNFVNKLVEADEEINTIKKWIKEAIS